MLDNAAIEEQRGGEQVCGGFEGEEFHEANSTRWRSPARRIAETDFLLHPLRHNVERVRCRLSEGQACYFTRLAVYSSSTLSRK
jgi:hypothetical protein